MAEIDDLLRRIPDDKLKKNLARAVARLRDNKKFGLVFESHIPETIDLYGLPVRPGMTVQLRREPADPKRYRVVEVSTNGKQATIETDDGLDQRSVATADLLVVKGFGEPMYAALTSVGAIQRGEQSPHHAVIRGENYHALQLLLYLYEGQVDCIYIDPPYNTGNAKDWKYNNRYVDDNDSYRHSKWLAMMEKRLKLARRLLRPDGVLIVMIDEYELHRLGLLVERLFKGRNHYMVSIVTNWRGTTGASGNFGVVEEQALFVVPDVGHDLIEPREAYIPYLRDESAATNPAMEVLTELARSVDDVPALFAELGVELSDEQAALFAEQSALFQDARLDEEAAEADDAGAYWTSARRTGELTSFRTQRPKQFYPIYIDDKKRVPIRAGSALLAKTKTDAAPAPSFDRVDGLLPIWPLDGDDAERVWCFQPDRMNREIAAGNLRVGRYDKRRGTYALSIRRYKQGEARFRERTVWRHPSYDAGANGTGMLKRLLGKAGVFSYPKSVYAVRDTLATVVGSRPNALIVDFFAGSATTLHATMFLNALDEGDRRCIAVTNNEVDPEETERLHRQGFFTGDSEFEASDIFERAAMPRVRAATTGQLNGKPLTGTYKWADNRPLKDGFDENVEFFRLDYLDPDEVDLGRQLEAIMPALWLASGGVGPREVPSTRVGWSIPEGSTYGVLLRESRFRPFAAALEARPEVSHVWLVTDSETAYADMVSQLPSRLTTSMLYRDYLRNFRINVEPSA